MSQPKGILCNHTFEPESGGIPGASSHKCAHPWRSTDGTLNRCGLPPEDEIHILRGLAQADFDTYKLNSKNATDHVIGMVKRFRWLPAFRWNLVPAMPKDNHKDYPL